MTKRKRTRTIEEITERTGTKEFIQLIDIDTGEVIDAFWRERREKPSGRPPDGRKPQFYRVYRDNWRDLVLRNRLTIQEAGLLFSMMGFLQWNGPYIVDPATGSNLSESDLADLLGISQPYIHKLLAELNRKGLVSLVKRGVGRPSHIMLNSHLLFFGNRMQNLADHAVFDGVEWQPPRPVKYRPVETSDPMGV